MADQLTSRSGAAFALGLVAGVAATAAVIATRMRIFHFADCPECGTSLVVSYEPTDAEPCIRREDAVELPEGTPIQKAVRRAREHPAGSCRTVVIIG